MGFKAVESAQVDATAIVGDNTSIWGHAQVRENAEVGEQCIIGRGAYIGSGVRIGNQVKIQNLALIYEPAILDDGVFIGPAVVLTNDLRPRSINPDGTLKSGADWEAVGVHVSLGASVGARAVCVAPLTIGEWAMVAAGSTVTKDVPDYALVAGAPAKIIGWVGRSGERLKDCGQGSWRCPTTGETYEETSNGLELQAEDNAN